MRSAALLSIAAITLCLAGCSTAEHATPDGAASTLAFTGTQNANLYVADLSAITVYAPGSDSPLRSIPHLEPSAIALDGSGNLYVANIPTKGSGDVTVFRAAKSSILRKISNGVADPRALTFDAAGNLYVANSYFRVAEYAPGKTAPERDFKVFYPAALAFDHSGNLYAASDPSPYGGKGHSKILVFGPEGKLLRTIVNGLHSPVALAFSSVGNLFVANYDANTITIYAPGKISVARTISQGIKGPYALVFDGSGSLYVANNLASTVTEYASGKSEVALTIRQGVSHPTALRLDVAGNLYVANAKSITVYAPGATAPMQTIVKGVNSPIAMEFGP
ncbi:MAG: NHL repeat-containing protein [Candidatus Tumulicola sp.]